MFRFVALALLAPLSACGDDGRAARIDDAIDLAGFWIEVDPDAPRPPMHLEIDNQAGVTDVVVVVDRAGGEDAIVAEEAALIGRLQNSNDQLAVRSALTIGLENDGVRDEVDGGDNVSFDGGDTTSLRVITAPYAANATVDDAASSLRWGLALDGDDGGLAGDFFVTSFEQRRVSGGDGVDSRADRFNLPVAFVRE